jgi:hypothetical protein
LVLGEVHTSENLYPARRRKAAISTLSSPPPPEKRRADCVEADTLAATARGEGGLGSNGV